MKEVSSKIFSLEFENFSLRIRTSILVSFDWEKKFQIASQSIMTRKWWDILSKMMWIMTNRCLIFVSFRILVNTIETTFINLNLFSTNEIIDICWRDVLFSRSFSIQSRDDLSSFDWIVSRSLNDQTNQFSNRLVYACCCCCSRAHLIRKFAKCQRFLNQQNWNWNEKFWAWDSWILKIFTHSIWIRFSQSSWRSWWERI
jgi:hypothetical protein